MQKSENTDIPIGISQLQVEAAVYTGGGMDWPQIRSRFISLRTARGLTQQDVAEAGEIPQGAVSKIESNTNQGPSVETFVKAVAGLGVTVSEFFLQIERPGKSDTTVARQSDTTLPSTPASGVSIGVTHGAHRVVSAAPAASRSDQLRDLADLLLTAADRIDHPAEGINQQAADAPRRAARGNPKVTRRRR